MTALPSFAVVGHPNKGKSSIVATLAEDDEILVSPVPGTTRTARRFTLSVDAQPLYQLIDTPGFQRSRELYAWLQEREGSAHERSQLLRDFVDEHAGDERFHDECELLRPIVDGAGILYVVDGAKPYGSEYEIEMEILRWSGRPRMALINLIGEGDFVEQWREALGQYFSIVRVFDAMHADFSRRIDLLRAFAELDEAWKPGLQQAVATLQAERARRKRLSAEEIAACLVEQLRLTHSVALAEDEAPDAHEERLTTRLKQDLVRVESRARKRVEDLYRHHRIEGEGASVQLMQQDLFTGETWQLFGLSRQQLAITGAVSGAVAGSGIDLVLGGASLMLGASIGAAIGSASAWFGAQELARVKVLGQSLGGRHLQVGPVQDLNFPWVILGRARLHHELISERNHARREAIALDAQRAKHLVDNIDSGLRRRMQRCFARITAQETDPQLEHELAGFVLEVLDADTTNATRNDTI